MRDRGRLPTRTSISSIRGEDLLPSTGRQIRLARLLGRSEPAGLPPSSADHEVPVEKLSKSDGDTGVRDLRARGWTPEQACERLRDGRYNRRFRGIYGTESSHRAPRLLDASTDVEVLENYVGGRWRPAQATEQLRRRPQPGGRPCHRARRRCRRARTSTPRSRRRKSAFPAWRDTPVVLRARALFRFVELLEAALRGDRAHRHDRARQDARRSARQRAARHRVRRGRLRRAVADDGLRPREHRHRTSTPSSFRQPLGVVRGDRAVQLSRRWCRCGSCRSPSPPATRIVLKPSEQVPLSQRLMFELLEQCDLPPGVVNLVNGGREVVEGDLRSPGHPRGVVRRIDAGGAGASTSAATHAGKRVQALGGAKNFVVVMPDADFERVDRDHHRVVLRLRRRALPGRQRAGAGRRGAHARRAIAWSSRRAALKVGDGLRAGRRRWAR